MSARRLVVRAVARPPLLSTFLLATAIAPALTTVLVACASGLVLAGPVRAQTQVDPAPQPTIGRPDKAGSWSADVKTRVVAPVRPRARAIKLEGDGDRTTVRIEVTRAITANIFTLDDPYRAVVDVADLEFQLPATAGTRGLGLVKAFRYGQLEAGRSRVVIDLSGPARVENASFAAPATGQPGALSFTLAKVAAGDFTAFRGPLDATSPAPPGKLRGPRHDETVTEAKAKPARGKGRPSVVIDPGHGGIDPGTVASPTLTEKAVTLAVALKLRALLIQSKRYDVHLTRQTDTFVSLDRRVKISREHGADLFVSIHADSLAEKELAQSISGATVYVLAESASDDVARKLAEKQNASDTLAGLAAVPASAEEQVRSILLDLVYRETANYSAAFRSLLLASLRGQVPLAKDPQRAAAFKVLKQPDIPAVMIELGYMSNAGDLARLTRPEGQRQVATAIAAAIDTFFARRDAMSSR